MNVGRGGGAGGEAGPSRRAAANAGEPRKPKKKKAKEQPRAPSTGPIPAPYLAIAPSPVSSLSRNALNDLIQPTPSHLVLPSTFVRARSSPNVRDAPVPAPSPPTARRGYAANLAAPPLIMPGGTSATPRIQEVSTPPTRRRDGRRRSEEGLRGLAQANQSMASLGVLGRIMESDPIQGSGEPPPARRRRRVIREDQRVSQPPVSTAEEGRAIGLARGASMRRLSVWDGLPDAGEAPPPFVVPPSAPAQVATSPTSPDPNDPPPPFEARGRSPPPTWEQATGQAPLPTAPVPAVPEPESAVTAGPLLSVEPPSRRASIQSDASSATQYASAHESPASSSGEEEGTEEEREDRRSWNADISAGYSLAQRVEREGARKRGRETRSGQEDGGPGLVGRTTEGSGEAISIPAEVIEPPVSIQVAGAERPASPVAEAPALPTAADVSAAETTTPLVRPPTSAVDPIAFPPPPTPNPPSPPLVPATPALPSAAVDTFTSTPATIDALSTTETALPAKAPAKRKTKKTATPSSISRSSEAGPSAPILAPLVIPEPPVDTGVPAAAPVEEPSAAAQPKISTRVRKRSTKDKTSAPTADPVPQPEQLPVSAVAEKALPSASSVQVEPAFSPKPLSPAQRSQADTYLALTGSTDPSLPPSPPKTSSSDQGSSSTQTRQPEPHTPAADPSLTPLSSTILTSVKESTEDSASQNGSDVVISPPPQRKLTRGKAIRRSSSGLSVLSDATLGSPTIGSGPAPGPESPRRPLFGETTFDWRPAHRRGGAEEPIQSVRPVPIHRKSASSVAILRSPPQSSHAEAFRHSGRALGSFDSATAALASLTSPMASPISEALPPHREAALKRRELVTRSPEIPFSIPDRRPPAPAPPPLIDLTSSTPPRPTPFRSPPLQIPRDLYQLFDEDEPIAESSSQAAARMEQEQILRAIKRDRREWAVDEVELGEERPPTPPAKPRRAPPPPPPLRRNLISTTVGANLTPRRSIIRSADTPVTPRPIRQLSVGSQDRPPVLPTRRPAPPPPPDNGAEEPLPAEAPPLPPRPAPLYRPLNERRESSFSLADTASSLSDRTIPLANSASASPRRPKGPRPPPPPPRWARIIMPLHDVKAPLRPTSERTQSDSASMSLADGIRNPTRRSTSEQDLRSSSGGSPLEYTDLDVLVSRLETSGREYEGFSQITAFLGPGKSLAAKPEALATLLPGLISVDSRRVTGQGKVKLKLSLLGVRVTKCPICLGQFKKDEKAVLLPECGHVSHEECASRWFREDWRCFVCRVPLLLDNPQGVGESGGRLEEGVI